LLPEEEEVIVNNFRENLDPIDQILFDLFEIYADGVRCDDDDLREVKVMKLFDLMVGLSRRDLENALFHALSRMMILELNVLDLVKLSVEDVD
jgi:hypothetical protein